MSEGFGRIYADVYDHIYRDKDYDGECDLLERIFNEYAPAPVHKVLDLGCGTGNHALRLAVRGYSIVGVDRSPEMLEATQCKARHEGISIRLHQADVREIDLQESFDAVLMMFAVLGYQLENSDVLNALRMARKHLKPDGLLAFDVWYGPAVLHQRPTQRIKVSPTPEGKILRFSSGELDIHRHLCRVHFHVLRLEGELLVAETEECHSMRYFFPRELDLLLECSGFAPIRLGAFPKFDQDPDETTWNVLGVARATEQG
jgi:SAM-dependent methyltransferase